MRAMMQCVPKAINWGASGTIRVTSERLSSQILDKPSRTMTMMDKTTSTTTMTARSARHDDGQMGQSSAGAA